MNKRIIYNLDSCTIIEILRSNPTVVNNMLKAVGTKNKIAICSVAYYEIMRGFDKMKPSRKQRIFEQFYSATKHFFLDDKAAEIAAEIYRYLSKRGMKIEDDDIFIAAMTLANDAVLITDNVKHFERVPNLKVVNWKDLTALNQ